MKSFLAKLFPCFFAGEQHICDRLPEELWTEIFGRLPSSSLLQCLLVCKSWRRFITSPSFVSSQLAKTLRPSTAGDGRRRPLLLCYSEGGNKFSLRFDDDGNFALLSDALVPPVAAFSTLGVVNGLVCLRNRSSLILWNPNISKFLTLPPPRKQEPDLSSQIKTMTGFGIGSGADDFKVLTVAAASSSGGKITPLVSDLYSLRTGSWKSIRSGTLNYELIPYQENNLAFASGRLHGIVQTDGKSRNLVLVFDLRTETFGEIMLPKCLTKVRASELCVKAFGDSSTIAVVRSEWKVLSVEQVFRRMVTNFEIWVMGKYGEAGSWDKVYDGVPFPGGGPASLLSFRRKDEAFVAVGTTSVFTLLELKGRSHRMVRDLSGVRTMPSFIEPYVKSLALLDKGKGIDLNRYPRRPSWISSAASWCLDHLRALLMLPMNAIKALGGFFLAIIEIVCVVLCSDPACFEGCVGACLQACVEVLLTAIFEACCGPLLDSMEKQSRGTRPSAATQFPNFRSRVSAIVSVCSTMEQSIVGDMGLLSIAPYFSGKYVRSLALLDKGKGIDLNRYPRKPSSWFRTATSSCLVLHMVVLLMNVIVAVRGFVLDCIKGVVVVLCEDPTCLGECFEACV
ncbi:unnamed protein product [Linum tenue]|uniref:F-box domain-containing protein n=1 Tax=Linum tenue TaxID=586396 RepID=A0AAV0LZI1_9ROSI|nr:unnamed protein product [Linum tenue]